MSGARVAILDHAVAVPRRRLTGDVMAALGWQPSPGVRSVAVCGADEDALTLAIEATRGLEGTNQVTSLGLASTSLPYVRKVQAGLVADWLDRQTLMVSEHTTSARAGTEALSLHAARVAGGLGGALVVAAETPHAEDRTPGQAPRGAAAAAVVLGPGPGVATLDAWSHAVAEQPGLDAQLRGVPGTLDVGLGDYESAAIAELTTPAVARVLDEAGVEPRAITTAVLAIPSRRLAAGLAGRAGLAAEAWEAAWPYAKLGDVGCAGALLGLSRALDTAGPGDRLLVVAYGGGGAVDALVLTAGDRPPGGARPAPPARVDLPLADVVKLLGRV